MESRQIVVISGKACSGKVGWPAYLKKNTALGSFATVECLRMLSGTSTCLRRHSSTGDAS